MMRPCEKCLENNWTFQVLDSIYIRATCKQCGHEVEWISEKLRRRQAKQYPKFEPKFSEADIRNQEGPTPWEV